MSEKKIEATTETITEMIYGLEYSTTGDTITAQQIIDNDPDSIIITSPALNLDTTLLIKRPDARALSVFDSLDRREQLIEAQREREIQVYRRTRIAKEKEAKEREVQIKSVPFYVEEKIEYNMLFLQPGQQYTFNLPVFIDAVPPSQISNNLHYSESYDSIKNAKSVIKSDEIEKSNIDWILGIIIISMLLLTWIKLSYSKYYDQLITSIHNYQASYRLRRDRNSLWLRGSLLLNLNYVLIGGVFLHHILDVYDIRLFNHNSFVNYLFYSGILLILLLARLVLTKIAASLFKQREIFSEYLHNVFVYYKNLGLLLVPIVIAISYININPKEIFIYFSLVIIFFMYMFRYFRGLQIILKKGVSISYLILYLCTLEILPFLLFYKYILGQLYQ